MNSTPPFGTSAENPGTHDLVRNHLMIRFFPRSIFLIVISHKVLLITVKETTKQKHKTSVCFTVVWLRGIESVRRVEVN